MKKFADYNYKLFTWFRLTVGPTKGTPMMPKK